MRFWRKRKQSAKSNPSQLSLERLEERAMMAVIPLASGETARFHDADGTEVKVKLLGPGQGTIELMGGVLTGAAIDTLSLTGTTGATTLKISTRGGSVAGTTISDVLIDNAIGQLDALKHFKAKHVTLTGDFTADGSIADFYVRSLGSGANVEVNGDIGRFKADNLASNARLEVAATLHEFVAKLLAAGSVVEANQIDMLKVKQQAMGASFNVGEGGLAQARLGWVYDTAVAAEGAIGNVVVKGDAMGSGIASNIDKGSDGVLGTIDDFVMDPAATGYVGAVTFRGNVGGAYPNQMVMVVSSDSIGNVQMRHSQQANLSLREDADPQFIPLSISQLTAGVTGFDNDEIYIAVFGEEIAIPPQGVAPPPAQNYYLMASALQHGNPQLLTTQSLLPSPSTPFLPLVPSSTIADWALNTSNVWGSNLQFPVPAVGNQFTGRIVISAGAPVQAQVNQDTYHSVSAPSASDFTDPSTGTFYDFLEFTVTNSAKNGISLDMDTSQVDSFGMPIGLQFFQDAAGTQPYSAPFQGNTTLHSLVITDVTNISSMVKNDNFGTGQPVTGTGIQPGTVVTAYDINANTVTLNKPAIATNPSVNLTAYPGGIVGVEAARSAILSGATNANLYEFLRTAIESGSPQARPFLQTVAPYTVLDPVQLTAANTTSVIITTADTTGLSAGHNVTISGVQGNLAANGTFRVAAVTPTSFTLGSPIGNANYTSGGVWTIPGSSTTPLLSSPSTNGQPVVIMTGNTVGLANGDTVLIEGAAGNSSINGLHVVSNVTATSFTIAAVNGDGNTISGGAWQRVQPISLVSGQDDPIAITTANADNIHVGGVIRVFDVGGNTAANGMFVVAAKSGNMITLGSPAGFDLYQSGGTWTGSQSGTGSVTGATNGGEIQISTASTTGLSNGHLVQISGVAGNAAANGFYLASNVTPTSFTLSGSIGSGVYTSGGDWTVHHTAIRYISPKDIVESLSSPHDTNGLNNYYNEMIDEFFLKYYTGTINGHQGGGQTFSLQSTAYDGTAHTYTGSVTNVNTANGNYALQLKDAAPSNADPTTYNIYYPWFKYNSGANSNAPSSDVYTPAFTLQEAPSWITANAWQTQSASRMIFACDAVFADNVARAAIDMTGNNAVKVLGDLENSISAAFNRGIILNDPANWYDTTQWFPATGNYNYWVEYWHQTGLTYSDLAYAFPYDDKFGASTNLNIGNVGLAKVTLGSWGSATAPTMSFTQVPQSAAPDSSITLAAQVTGSNPTGTVSFFINGIPINPNDDSQTPPMYPVTLDGSGTATITATLPALPSGANSATYTVTAVYSGDMNHLPSIAYTSLPLESALTVAVAPAAGVLGLPVTINTTLPDANPTGTLSYTISKSDGTNVISMGSVPVNSQNMSSPVTIPTNVVTFTGTADGSHVITGISSMADLLQNQVVSGTGVPTGTTITNIGAGSITLSNAVPAGTVSFTSNGAGAALPITVNYDPGNSQPHILGGTDFTVSAAPYSLGLVPGSGALGSTPTMTVTLPGPPYNGSIQFNISRPDGTDVQSLGSVNVNSNTLSNGNQVVVNNLAIPNDLLQFTAYADGTNTITGISTISGIVTNTQNISGGGVTTNYITGFAPPALLLTNAAAQTSTDPVTFTVNGVTITGTTMAGQQAVTVTSVSGWTPSSVLNGQSITDNDGNYYVGSGNTVQTFTAGSATMHVAVPTSNGSPVTFTSSANGSAYPITAVWTPSGASPLTSTPQLFGVT